MTALSLPAATVLPCSDADRAAGDSPIGSAVSFDSFLLLDHRAPWSRTAADDAVRALLPPAAQAALHGAERMRAFAVRPVRQRRTQPRACPRGGRVGPGAYLAALTDPPAASTLVALARGETRSGIGTLTGDIVIGVCTNAKRDRCCAVRGRPVALTLHDEFGDRVTEISHLGGHRFAATMLVLPSGYSYGQLSVGVARDVVVAALDGLVHPAHLRGRADLSPAAQAADAYWRSRIGPAAVDAVRIVAERPWCDGDDGDRTADGDGCRTPDPDVRVIAVVQGGTDELRVRYWPGRTIDATACGGKPIRTGRWHVTPV